MRQGTLIGTDAEHPASGTVIIEGSTIKLQDVQITEAPDARVILARNFEEPGSIRCGSLMSFSGSHEYQIPEGIQTADFDTVVIWCDQFSVPIGKAQL